MPWKSISIMQSRQEFVGLAEQGDVSVAELCRRFGISRQTGFGYLRRHREAGAGGLLDRSCRPDGSPRRSSAESEAQVIALRHAHPRLGGLGRWGLLGRVGAGGVRAPSVGSGILS